MGAAFGIASDAGIALPGSKTAKPRELDLVAAFDRARHAVKDVFTMTAASCQLQLQGPGYFLMQRQFATDLDPLVKPSVCRLRKTSDEPHERIGGPIAYLGIRLIT
jgi:hypothetical protein